MGGNLEKMTNVSINLRAEKRVEQEMSYQGVAEESKMQSPRSATSALAVVGADKPEHQSFRINDSTDSLMENPLTTVIKQF